MNYIAYFVGREKGAIGINYRINLHVEAANEDEARLKLYDTHEHISDVIFIEQSESIKA